METLDKYASGMTLYKFSFAVDSLHSLDCLWACEDGIWRNSNKSHMGSFLFQDLHYQRDNGVSTMITKSIIISLSKGLPKNDKDVFTSKSLNIVSITKMASHGVVDLLDSHGFSGHGLGTNQ